jgi:hypothetical protein
MAPAADTRRPGLRAGRPAHYRGHGAVFDVRDLLACGACGAGVLNMDTHRPWHDRITPSMAPASLTAARMRDWTGNELAVWGCTSAGSPCGVLVLDRAVHADFHDARGLGHVIAFTEITRSINLLPLMLCGDCGGIVLERFAHDGEHRLIDPRPLFGGEGVNPARAD